MSVKSTVICDICGEEVIHPNFMFGVKIKRLDSDFHVWEKLDVHKSCWQEMCEEIARRRKDDKRDR